MEKQVLIVEDEAKLSLLLQEYLCQSCYQSHCLDNGLAVVPWLQQHKVDLILLDLMLPGRNGMDICRDIRQFSDIPIIILTARIEEIDRLLGLELGADDYICKPYSPREVMARIKALFRRIDGNVTNQSLQSSFALNSEQMEITLNNKSLELTPVEFRLLSTLLDKPGKVYSRNQLLDLLYDDHRIVTDRNVDSHIKNLRRKIANIIPDQEIIISVYGVGYKCNQRARV